MPSPGKKQHIVDAQLRVACATAAGWTVVLVQDLCPGGILEVISHRVLARGFWRVSGGWRVCDAYCVMPLWRRRQPNP